MRGRWKADLLVLLGYTAISFAYFGWRLLPHPGRVIIGYGHDPEVMIWSFAWWPHAIGSFSNPFVTDVLYAPDGVNLAWTATAPALALAFAPITVLFGPVAAYNVAALLIPALAAWTAYLLCKELTGSVWASVVGGYLFGFSIAFLRQQLLGHLHVTAVFLLPLVAVVVVRYVKGDLAPRGLALRLGALLGLQLWISTEFALTATLALALGLALAFWLVREARPRLRSALTPIAGAYALGAVMAAPILVYTLIDLGGDSFVDVRGSGSDLLNLVVPTATLAVSGSWLDSLTDNLRPAGASAYVGLPALIIVAAYAGRARSEAWARFLLVGLGACVLVVLGTTLVVDGRELLPLPWAIAPHVPLLQNVFPFRFAVYLSLVVAVIVAVWTATTKGSVLRRPYVLPALAMVALLPSLWRTTTPSFRPTQPERLAFFTEGRYESCLGPGETVAIFPFGIAGDSLLWQAESGFDFRLAADGLLNQPKYAPRLPLSSFTSDRIVWELNWADAGRPTIDRLLAFAAIHGVDRVISVPSGGYPSRAQMRRFGPTELVGGALVAPACGQPSLAERDLTPYVERYRAEQLRSRPNIGYCIGLNFNLLPQGLYPALLLEGAKRAVVVAGQGLTCSVPEGYRRRGFAPVEMGVPANTYPLYVP